MNRRRRPVLAWLSRALILCMVPLVWLASTPEMAAAASSETLSLRLSADWIDNVTGYGDADCVLPLAINGDVGGASVTMTGAYCKAGPDFSPMWCVGFEYQCSSYTLVIKSQTGQCASQGLSDYAGSSDGMTQVHTAFSSVSVYVGACDPNEICLVADVGGSDIEACTSSSLDPPPITMVEGCEATNYATVNAPVVTGMAVIPASGSYRVRVTVQGDIPGPLTGQATESWVVYMFGSNLQGTTTYPTTIGTLEYWDTTVSAAAGVVTHYTFISDSGLMSLQAANEYLNATKVRGLGLYSPMPGDNSSSLKAVPLPSGASSAGRLGISRPDRCAYYWGDKIADYGTVSPYDEPIGPIVGPTTGEPVQPPPVVEPEPEVDPDDGPSWWSWIGELLKMIWNAVKGVITAVGKIAGQVLDGLEALFVPDNPNALKVSVQGMADAFDGKFPFSLAEEVDTLGTGISGGCPDWRVKVVGDFDENIVCDSSFTGAIRGARGFILAGMLALAFWPLMRGVFYASVPVLKPTPVGGK